MDFLDFASCSNTAALSSAGSGSGLVTSGLLGYWEADNLSKIYKEIAGTTNVSADGDTVGMWKNNLSDGFDVTAAADNTTRPLYKTGGGLHWILYDGSDDILFRNAALGVWGSNSGACTIVQAVQSAAASQTNIVAEAHSTTTGSYFPDRGDVADFNDAKATQRRDDGTFALNAVLVGDELYPTNTDVVAIFTDSNTLLSTYKDGSALGNSGAYSRSGTTSLDRFAIGGRRVASSSSAFFNGRIYGIWIYNRVLDSSELAQMTTYAGTKQGRTI